MEGSHPNMQEKYSHKNRLQQYTGRAALAFPIYQTINEGNVHAPKFKSTVVVDGVTYSTAERYMHVKDAEQAIAKHAYECILKKIQDEGSPIINEDIKFNKAILNEFANKKYLKLPTYTTAQTDGMPPAFISTVAFGGKPFQGASGKNKKEAENLAAGTVMKYILANSAPGRLVLFEIIKSKKKLFNTMHKVKDFQSLSSGVNPENGSCSSVIQKPVVRDSTELPSIGNPMAGSEQPQALAVLPHLSVKKEPLSETSSLSIGDMTPGMDPGSSHARLSGSLDVTVSSAQATAVVGTNRKKRLAKKMKKNAQKKLRRDNKLITEADPAYEAPSCPAAL
ncbi:hypothetical protein GIB67_002544 [Kingdonia uniflora]|uniref:DRBM domain-containing protein n=1 Tax=Kingdonia uniflora TaxID=39325 RepID=A0A7J7N8H9_9MAGN|nr:hypothetical protein GIB67_002544 [Kingdonia uniflora]